MLSPVSPLPPFACRELGPITEGHEALAVLLDALHDTPRVETLVLLRCAAGRGGCIMPISNAAHHDSVVGIVEALAPMALRCGYDAMAVASVRPGEGPDPDDAARWVDIDLACDLGGVQLLDWFVVGRELVIPREWCGEPSRWAA